MSKQTWVETLITAQIDGTALASSTSATSILPPAAIYTLPANYFEIGRAIRIKAHGRISNIVTTPGTLTLDVRFGAVIVANGGTMALNTTAKTNVPWMLEWTLTCRSIGASTSATMMHQGRWTSESVIGSALPSAGGAGTHLLPNATPAVGTGFASTSSQTVDLFAKWSVSDSGNSIQLHGYTLEALN